MTTLLTDDEGFTLGWRASRDSMHWSPAPPPCQVPPEMIAQMYDPPLTLERGWYQDSAGGWRFAGYCPEPEQSATKRRPAWLSLLLWPFGMLGRARRRGHPGRTSSRTPPWPSSSTPTPSRTTVTFA